MDTETLLKHRVQKFRKLGGFQEGIPIDPKRKVNMKKKEEPIVAINKASEVELRDEVEKLKEQILEAAKSSTGSSQVPLKEMIEKLKVELDYEYDEAAKALGMDEKILMVREEIAKARNVNDQLGHPALKVKIDQLMDEFQRNLPTAPNYSSLKYKLDLLKELSNASNISKKSTSKDGIKNEINKRFSELVDRPEVKQKIEALKAEIANSGVTDVGSSPELRTKIMQLSAELESEFKDVLKSVGLQIVSADPSSKAKVDAFQEEVSMIIDDFVNSSDLKEKIELLKEEVAKAGDKPDEESKTRIQSLVEEIKEVIKEGVSSKELKEKHEKLVSQILEAPGSSVEGAEDDEPKVDESKVNVNLEVSRSFV